MSQADIARHNIVIPKKIPEVQFILELYGEKFSQLPMTQQMFFAEFLRTGNITGSWKSTHACKSKTLAYNLGRKVLERLGFNMISYLEAVGHNDDRLALALDRLFEKDPDKYLNHIEKLRRLVDTSIKLDATITPIINIITEKPVDRTEKPSAVS